MAAKRGRPKFGSCGMARRFDGKSSADCYRLSLTVPNVSSNDFGRALVERIIRCSKVLIRKLPTMKVVKERPMTR